MMLLSSCGNVKIAVYEFKDSGYGVVARADVGVLTCKVSFLLFSPGRSR